MSRLFYAQAYADALACIDSEESSGALTAAIRGNALIAKGSCLWMLKRYQETEEAYVLAGVECSGRPQLAMYALARFYSMCRSARYRSRGKALVNLQNAVALDGIAEVRSVPQYEHYFSEAAVAAAFGNFSAAYLLVQCAIREAPEVVADTLVHAESAYVRGRKRLI